MSTCRVPTRSRLFSFMHSGISSRLAITQSSSGQMERETMWSTLNWSPLYGLRFTVGALPLRISARPSASRRPSFVVMSRLRSSAAFVRSAASFLTRSARCRHSIVARVVTGSKLGRRQRDLMLPLICHDLTVGELLPFLPPRPSVHADSARDQQFRLG